MESNINSNSHSLKNNRKNAIVNILQVVFLALISFLTYKIIISYLGISILGVWSVVLSIVSVSKLADFGIGDAVTRLVAIEHSKNNVTEISKIFSTAFISVFVIFFLFAIPIYFTVLFFLARIFNANDFKIAQDFLPFTILSFGLTLLSSILQSSLDGCNKMLLRGIATVTSQLFYLGFIYFLIPVYGLIALAWAQLFQSILLLILCWSALASSVKNFPMLSLKWSKEVFKKTFAYGLNIQIATLVMLFFDPFTKSMLAFYGGASISGYFEIANQIVLKLRSLIVSANKSIIPFIAELSEHNYSAIKKFYLNNVKVLLHFLIPSFLILFVFADIINALFFHQKEYVFIQMLKILIVAWGLNTVNVPAYFINLGTGQLKNNTIAHLIIGVINLLFVSIFYNFFGIFGPFIAYCFALVVGSLYLVFFFQKKNGLGMSFFGMKENKELWISSVVYFLGAQILTKLIVSDSLTYNFLILILTVIYIYIVLTYTPLKKYILGQL